MEKAAMYSIASRKNMLPPGRIISILTVTFFLSTGLHGLDSATAQRQARIKDIASIEGIRDNQLVGYGIVVGLQGTGDSQQTTFPTQTLASTLLRMGVSVPASAIRVQNLAAVFVSAVLQIGRAS